MTQKKHPDPTRRRVLASVGAVGAGTYGFLRFGDVLPAGSERRYTHYTYAQTDEASGPKIRIAWYSTYNGELLFGTPTNDDNEWRYDDEEGYADGIEAVLSDRPAIDVSNVLPGDSGTLSVGLFAESSDARVWMRLRTDHGTSTLADAVRLTAWYDTGIFGIRGCRGAEGASGFDRILDGTLGTPGVLAQGHQIDPGLLDNSVLPAGERLCLALSWALPTNAGNELQGTAAGFDLEFRAVEPSFSENPFTMEERDD